MNNKRTSQELFMDYIKAKAKEDGVKLSKNELYAVISATYSSIESKVDVAFHNVKAFDL